MRSADRTFLRKATVATISQDVRKSRLLVRFRAGYLDAGGALQLRAGILGQTRVPEGGALNLCDATLRVFQEFCTIQQAPLSSKSAEGRLDAKLLERFLTIVQFFVADAASDEQAAGTCCEKEFGFPIWNRDLPISCMLCLFTLDLPIGGPHELGRI